MEERTIELRVRMKAVFDDPSDARTAGLTLDHPEVTEAVRYAVMESLLRRERNGFPRATPEGELLSFGVLSTEVVEGDPRDDLLLRLHEWAGHMGGWEAKVWDDLSTYINDGLLPIPDTADS